MSSQATTVELFVDLLTRPVPITLPPAN